MTLRLAALIALTVALVACGGEDKFDGGKTADSSTKGKGSDGIRKPGNTETSSGDGGTDSADAGDGDGLDGGGSDGGAGGGGSGDETGEAYFNRAVQPVLQAQCVSCHADPRIKVDVRGPLSIYSYARMRTLLAVGGSTNSDLLNKVRNVTAHTGGNRCTKGMTSSPCKELVAWWTFEFGADTGSPGTSTGKINDVSALGRVFGWAVDPANTTNQVALSFYVDGPLGVGTSVGTSKADRSGADGNTPGDHAFVFDLPEAMRNGKARKLYVYASIGGAEVLVGGAPIDYTAYAFTAAGRSYYEANVKSQLSSCAGCHTVSYEQQFYSMIAPSPAQGGTAGNNQLVNKPAQVNGTTHGGGPRCTSATAGLCGTIQAWWNVEFAKLD